MLEFKITFAALAIAIAAALTPSQQAQVIIAAIIGAGLGGLMGSYYFPGRSPGHITIRKRWITNSATGTICGPLLADWMQPKYFPESPILFVTLFAAGAVGALGVLLLTITIPPFYKWIVDRFFRPPTNPG